MYEFKAFGHKNISGKHLTTLEFTRYKILTPRGDCILGVEADFDAFELRDFIERKIAKGDAKLTVHVKAGKHREIVKCTINPTFDDPEEIVIRKGSFTSNRTLGIYADKACVDFKRQMIKALQNPEQEILVILK